MALGQPVHQATEKISATVQCHGPSRLRHPRSPLALVRSLYFTSTASFFTSMQLLVQEPSPLQLLPISPARADRVSSPLCLGLCLSPPLSSRTMLDLFLQERKSLQALPASLQAISTQIPLHGGHQIQGLDHR